MSGDSVGVAVVTGASRGIGRATALALAARGMDVALIARTAGELDDAARAIAALGRRAIALPCDVAEADEVARAAREAERALGVPRLVVNNAGIVRRAKVEDMAERDWNDVLAVGLTGAFLVTRAFLTSMRGRGRGRFVAVGSISSTLGTAKLSAYCASKWGLVGFTKALAEELRGSGLQAMAVLPGSVDTAMLEGSGFSPAMSPEEVAKVIAYAGLDAPDAMNGSAIEVFGP